MPTSFGHIERCRDGCRQNFPDARTSVGFRSWPKRSLWWKQPTHGSIFSIKHSNEQPHTVVAVDERSFRLPWACWRGWGESVEPLTARISVHDRSRTLTGAVSAILPSGQARRPKPSSATNTLRHQSPGGRYCNVPRASTNASPLIWLFPSGHHARTRSTPRPTF